MREALARLEALAVAVELHRDVLQVVTDREQRERAEARRAGLAAELETLAAQVAAA